MLRQIRAHTINRCTASPAFFEQLLRGDDGTLRRLQKIYTGGAPVFPTLLAALRESAPDACVEAVFGSTEAEPIAHIEEREISAADRAAMLAGRGLLTGRPVAEIQLRILRDQWGRPIGPWTPEELTAASLPPGEGGEIVVSGGHVLSGYLHGHGDAETKFRVDGTVWHRTGDAGYLDDLGRLWLLGRCTARLTDARGTLWPFAVECAAMNCAGVERAALTEVAGHRVLALQLAKGAEVALVTVREELHWAALDKVRVLPKIPVDKRHNAKIDYPALRALLR